MFKKIISLALAVIMIMSVAMIAASAAEVEVADNAADVPAEVGADAEAETGAGNTISFDVSTAGWNNTSWVAFHIWPVGNEDFEAYAWGAKKQRGKASGDIYTYDLDKAGFTIQPGHQYAVIFYNNNGAQTYNLLFGAECIGKTAYCDGVTFENPEDSNKTAQQAVWGGGIDASVYGPELKISSIGTVVGSCCAASTTPYNMFVDFLSNTLTNARTFSGKDDQTLLDDTASKLGIGQDDIEAAIKEAGVTVEWTKAESKAPEESDPGVKESGTPSSPSSPSSPSTKTGQETTVLFIMLGVMVAAAGVIFFARKRERA